MSVDVKEERSPFVEAFTAQSCTRCGGGRNWSLDGQLQGVCYDCGHPELDRRPLSPDMIERAAGELCEGLAELESLTVGIWWHFTPEQQAPYLALARRALEAALRRTSAIVARERQMHRICTTVSCAPDSPLYDCEHTLLTIWRNMHKWERLQSTACECGDRRAWKNGPCVNAACRHYRTKLTAKEAAISLAIAVLLLAFAAWAILVPIF